jgi:Protein of unknown function (DUF1045)
MMRAALYFAPPAQSPWWQAGCRWLGRDPESGVTFDTPEQHVTREPRRYGWHGTLVAPFRCVATDAVLAAARAWASSVKPFDFDVQAVEMGRFVALRAAHPAHDAALRDIAASALRALAPLRTRASKEENERRIRPGMSAHQIALLHEWDYPYVLDEYRFHMTLSDSLDHASERDRIVAYWNKRIPELGPMPFHGAAVFVEAQPGIPFALHERTPFSNARNTPQ